METIPTSKGQITLGDVIADLVYVNYACNRDSGSTPDSWKKVYDSADVDRMEARYQAAKMIARAAAC